MTTTKKSLLEAIREAETLSKEHPAETYYVMDKKGKRAACHGSKWCYIERTLEGYHTVERWKNGEKIST